jgi:hypothetical protein
MVVGAILAGRRPGRRAHRYKLLERGSQVALNSMIPIAMRTVQTVSEMKM